MESDPLDHQEVPVLVCLIVLTRVVCVHARTCVSHRTGTEGTLTFLLIQPVKGNCRTTTSHRPSRTGVTLSHSHMFSQFTFTALGGSYCPCSESEARKLGQVSQIETTEKRVWRIESCATTAKFTVSTLHSSASSGLLGTW